MAGVIPLNEFAPLEFLNSATSTHAGVKRVGTICTPPSEAYECNRTDSTTQTRKTVKTPQAIPLR